MLITQKGTIKFWFYESNQNNMNNLNTGYEHFLNKTNTLLFSLKIIFDVKLKISIKKKKRIIKTNFHG